MYNPDTAATMQHPDDTSYGHQETMMPLYEITSIPSLLNEDSLRTLPYSGSGLPPKKPVPVDDKSTRSGASTTGAPTPRPPATANSKNIATATRPSPPVQENELTPQIREIHAQAAKEFNNLRYSTAAPLLKQVVDLLPDKTSPLAIQTAFSTATAYSLSGKHEESLSLLETLLGQVVTKFGENSLLTARVHVAIGNAKGDARDNEAKITILQDKAIPLLEKHLGPSNKETLLARALLANAYGNLRQAQKQKDILTEVLEQMIATLPPGDIEIVRTQGNLANAHGLLKEFPQQLRLLQQVLATKERIYGKDHVELARTLHNIALAYGNQGDHIQKLEMLERCMAIKESRYERDSIEHVPTLRSKAQAHLDLSEGGTNEHYKLYTECLEKAKRILEAQPQRGPHLQEIERIDKALRGAGITVTTNNSEAAPSATTSTWLPPAAAAAAASPAASAPPTPAPSTRAPAANTDASPTPALSADAGNRPQDATLATPKESIASPVQKPLATQPNIAAIERLDRYVADLENKAQSNAIDKKSLLWIDRLTRSATEYYHLNALEKACRLMSTLKTALCLPKMTYLLSRKQIILISNTYSLIGKHQDNLTLLSSLLGHVEEASGTQSLEYLGVNEEIAKANECAKQYRDQIKVLQDVVIPLRERLHKEQARIASLAEASLTEISLANAALEKVLLAKASLAKAYANIGNIPKQKEILIEALAYMPETSVPYSDTVMNCELDLADADGQLEEDQNAITLLESILQKQIDKYGPDQAVIARTLHIIAKKYHKQDKHEKCLEALEQCWAILQKYNRPDSIRLIPVLRDKANTHQALSKSPMDSYHTQYINDLTQLKNIWQSQPTPSEEVKRSIQNIERELELAKRAQGPASTEPPEQQQTATQELLGEALRFTGDRNGIRKSRVLGAYFQEQVRIRIPCDPFFRRLQHVSITDGEHRGGSKTFDDVARPYEERILIRMQDENNPITLVEIAEWRIRQLRKCIQIGLPDDMAAEIRADIRRVLNQCRVPSYQPEIIKLQAELKSLRRTNHIVRGIFEKAEDYDHYEDDEAPLAAAGPKQPARTTKPRSMSRPVCQNLHQ